MVECVRSGERTLAFLIRADAAIDRTTFLTPPAAAQQVGFIVRPGGDAVARHYHPGIERRSADYSELLFVREGACELDLYDDDRRLVATRRLGPGDLVLLAAGGHGLRMIEPTVLLEVKPGPYAGVSEKVLF
jgi:hypothetical protein